MRSSQSDQLIDWLYGILFHLNWFCSCYSAMLSKIEHPRLRRHNVGWAINLVTACGYSHSIFLFEAFCCEKWLSAVGPSTGKERVSDLSCQWSCPLVVLNLEDCIAVCSTPERLWLWSWTDWDEYEASKSYNSSHCHWSLISLFPILGSLLVLSIHVRPSWAPWSVSSQSQNQIGPNRGTKPTGEHNQLRWE